MSNKVRNSLIIISTKDSGHPISGFEEMIKKTCLHANCRLHELVDILNHTANFHQIDVLAAQATNPQGAGMILTKIENTFNGNFVG